MLKTFNLYQAFYENQVVPNLYSDFTYNDNGPLGHKLQWKDLRIKKQNIYNIELFPNYLKSDIIPPAYFKIKKVKQKLGFAVNLKNHGSVLDYIKECCSTQHRKNITRAVNRLETCFEVKYQTYYGDMAEDHYKYIMQCLKNMIERRFMQRAGRNKTLTVWERHVGQTLTMIQQKKASIFVIYNQETPIEISINYHIGSLMYSAISSYNLDYNKFSLGNIEIYKQLEWCLANNIDFFDMGYGDFDYKRKWGNDIYHFENHIFYHKYNPLGPVFAVTKKYLYKLIDYLISKNINDNIYHIIYKLTGRKQEVSTHLEYKLIPLKLESPELATLKMIELNDERYHQFKQPVYDGLYKYQEHIKDIKAYEAPQKINSVLIKGKNRSFEISITNK